MFVYLVICWHACLHYGYKGSVSVGVFQFHHNLVSSFTLFKPACVLRLVSLVLLTLFILVYLFHSSSGFYEETQK